MPILDTQCQLWAISIVSILLYLNYKRRLFKVGNKIKFKYIFVKGCDQIIVVGHKSATETQVDDVEDYDYDNAADRNDYCPDVDDDQDAYGEFF